MRVIGQPGPGRDTSPVTSIAAAGAGAAPTYPADGLRVGAASLTGLSRRRHQRGESFPLLDPGPARAVRGGRTTGPGPHTYPVVCCSSGFGGHC